MSGSGRAGRTGRHDAPTQPDRNTGHGVRLSGSAHLRNRTYRDASGVLRHVPTWSGDFTLEGKRYSEPLGTTDYAAATELLAQRIAARKMGAPVATEAPTVTLAAFVAEHIERRRQSRKFTEGWIDVNEQHLERAVAQFGAERKLASITVQDVAAWSVQAPRRRREAGHGAASLARPLEPLQAGAGDRPRAVGL